MGEHTPDLIGQVGINDVPGAEKIPARSATRYARAESGIYYNASAEPRKSAAPKRTASEDGETLAPEFRKMRWV